LVFISKRKENMTKFQYTFIMYAILMILVRMGEASQDAIVSTVTEKETLTIEVESTVTEEKPFEKLCRPILKIILEYLDIQSGFKFLFMNREYYKTHWTTLTKVATAQYSHFFCYPDNHHNGIGRSSTIPPTVQALPPNVC